MLKLGTESILSCGDLTVSGGVSSTVGEEMAQARTQLHFILSEALLGDRLAAEYLLSHLVSKVTRN